MITIPATIGATGSRSAVAEHVGAVAGVYERRHSLLAASYIGIVAWSAATLLYQLAAGRSPLWTSVALALPPCLRLLCTWSAGGVAQLDEPAAEVCLSCV